MNKGALHNIRVLDTTRALAGPLCTMVLADLGADVIKVELPKVGDETRYWGPPFAGNAGPTLIGYNRNKRSIGLDLHTREGQQTCLALARTCDVFVENFRPGTVKRFGLDYETVRKARPDIVYCSVSGYGQTGPLASRPAVDLMVQALSGLMAQTGEPKGRPVKAAAPTADVMGGLSAAISIMAALTDRSRSGEGRYLDISMMDGMFMLMGQAIAAWGMSGRNPRRWGNGHPLMSPYESFRCADREIVIAVTNQKAWTTLTELPEFAVLGRDERFSTPPLRSEHREQLVPAVEAVMMRKPAEYWLEIFDRIGIPSEPINTLVEMMEHPQVAYRGMLQEIEYPPNSGNRIRTAGMPWRAVAAERFRSPPDLGQHTDEILAELAKLAGEQV
jgi:crotonobetainyl-CoA:carnitine CoA-transferase CaiB-like acyl-CoA transferase